MPEMNRRGFLVASSLTAAGLLWGSTRTAANAGDDGPVGAPFTLGVASGDPAPDGVVLWTRLAPAPFEPDGGMPNRLVPVHWRIAEDEAMTRIVQEGTVIARPEEAHSVHVEPVGLLPAREYWYHFQSGPHVSAPGRTRTAPSRGSHLNEFV